MPRDAILQMSDPLQRRVPARQEGVEQIRKPYPKRITTGLPNHYGNYSERLY